MSECTVDLHVFDIDDDTITPDEQPCLCEGVTWGEMNERLAFHSALEGRGPEWELLS